MNEWENGEAAASEETQTPPEETVRLDEAEPADESDPAQTARQRWSIFVEGTAADFFTGYKLEKMSIEDGNGNKAKFSRTKNDEIKVEYTSSVML